MTRAHLSGAVGAVPRALLGRPMASAAWPRALLNAQRFHGASGRPSVSASAGDPKAILAQIKTDFESFQSRHRGEMGDFQDAFDGLNARVAALSLSSGSIVGNSLEPAPDPAYSRPFAQWFRTGQEESEIRQANALGDRARIQAAMSSGSNSDGGYLAPVEWDRQITKALTLASPLRTICNVIQTSGPGYSTIWNDGQWGSGWVGETATRPQTTNAQLASVIFKPGEIFAMPAMTQQLLDDAQINIEDWLALEVADTFAKQEAIAFVSGNGTNKPLGFLSYVGTGTTLHPGGEPGVTASGSAVVITGDGLIDMVYSLAAPYRANASWLMNSATIAKVSKLKDGQGNYLWQPSFIAGQPPTLLGKPVYFEESMPDVAGGAYPIAFGDWRRFYVINDRTGVRVLRDPFTTKPFVLFYTTKRVGGGILDPRAVRFLKVAAS